MTVAELIAILQTMPQDAAVMRPGDDPFYRCTVEATDIEIQDWFLNPLTGRVERSARHGATRVKVVALT